MSEGPVSITVYTREDCHLCEEAIDTIERVADEAGVELALELVDVDTDEELRETYGERVPYVLVDGSPAFKYRVEERELRRKLSR
jgi:glutaredoxin